jgi:hypothetical protein
MNLHVMFDTASAVRLAIALVIAGAILLLYARLLFGPLPKGQR